MGFREQAEAQERWEERAKGMEQGYKLALNVMEMNMDEILAFGEYAKMVHPEDLPIDYKRGMKLVPWEQWNAEVRIINHIQHILGTPALEWLQKFIAIRDTLRYYRQPDDMPNDNPFAES